MGLFIFIILTFLLGLVGGLIYLVYLPFRNRFLRKGRLTKPRSKQINTIYICIIVVISAYLTFDAFFPGKSFYENEFKTVTLRDLPKSAKFVEKAASYPDLHGGYFSSSQIRLSKTDYNNLLYELTNDNRIAKSREIRGAEEFSKTLGDKESKNIIYGFTRQITGKENHYLFIGFYNDGQTIFVNIGVT